MDVEIIREGPSRNWDPYEIKNKQPGVRYRLANKNGHRREQLERQGYRVVQANDPEQLTFSASTPLKEGAPSATTREYHDLVLMKISLEAHKTNIADPTHELARRRKGMHEREFVRAAKGPSGERLGFETTDKEDRSFKTSMDEDEAAKAFKSGSKT